MIKVVITRPMAGAKTTVELGRQMGFDPISFPLLLLSPLNDINLKWHISEYKWILFTSSNSVKFFMDFYSRNKIHFTHDIKIAAVGPSTEKSLNNIGLKADFVPTIFNRTAISEQIPVRKEDLLLYPTVHYGPNKIESILQQKGCRVDRIDVYKSEPILYQQEEWQKLISAKPDIITFFSPRTVQAFFENSQRTIDLKNYTIAVLAESSENALLKKGYSVQIKPEIPTAEHLFKKILEYYA